jgi:hypothetical protein
MQGLAAIQEGLFEGYYGNRNISYAGAPTQARLKIKHSQPLGENDARFRHVESLFVETADGECFRLGFRNLSGGRAMLEHVRQGGKPYDIRGCHLTEIVNEIATLARFNRASTGRVLEGVTQEVVSQAQVYYKQLRENLKRMSTSRGYSKYFESWHPADITEQEELVENIKTLFVEQTIDTRIEQALPLLAKIQQGLDMKEAKIFESWIDNLAEGTWNLPETPEQLDKLKTMMASELIVGPDAINATEQLYDLVGDDILFDRLSELAEKDPRANAWNDTEVMNRLAELGIQMPEPSVPGNPAEPATAPVAATPAAPVAAAPAPVPVAESAELNTMLKYAGIPLREGVLDDVRARMDARRNPAATPATAQPVQSPTTQAPKFKVGDTVSFGIGRGVPSTGTITAMGPGPTQLTVKTAEGENQLDTRMKSLYLQLATATTSAESQQSTPDLPRAEVVSTMGMPSRSLIGYKDNTYTPSGPYTKAPEGATGTQVLVPAAAFGIRSMGDVVALLTDDGTAYAEQPIKVSNPFGRAAGGASRRPESTQGLDEAGEWKAEAEDFKEWSNHVKNELLDVAPSQRFAMAKRLSQIEMKHFGAGQAATSFNNQTGASTGNSSGMTTTVQHILDAINDGKLTAATSSAATAAIASAGTTQQTPFGSVTRPAGQPDPYQASPALASGDRPAAVAAQNRPRPQQGGGSIRILRTEQDWEEALNDPDRNRDLGADGPTTAADFGAAMAKLPSWKVMLSTILLGLKLPIVGDKIRNILTSKMKDEFGVSMSPKEVIEYMGHVRNTAPDQIVPPAVWKFEKDGGDYETALEQLPDDAVSVRPAEVMSSIANDLISAGVAQEIKPEDETPSGAGAFGNMASQLTKKDEPVAESTELNTMLKYAGIPVAESRVLDEAGETIDHILNRFKHEVGQFEQGNDLDSDLYDALFDYYSDKGEIPYGIAKARTGDPFSWVSDKLADHLGVNEGWKGAIAGGLAGGALGSVVPALGTLAGAAAGAYAGHKLGDQGFKDPDAEYKKAQKLKQQPSVDEADAISTFEVMSGFDAPVAEGSCNMTSEGAYCPEHGLAECGGGGMYESREGDAMLARIKSLALIR